MCVIEKRNRISPNVRLSVRPPWRSSGSFLVDSGALPPIGRSGHTSFHPQSGALGKTTVGHMANSRSLIAGP
jgi:hypothetical protein